MSEHVNRRVVCAAIRRNADYAIICGPRHYDTIMRAQIRDSMLPDTWKGGLVQQGFVDQHGVFMDRHEALEVALNERQILRKCGGDTAQLFSENLY